MFSENTVVCTSNCILSSFLLNKDLILNNQKKRKKNLVFLQI